MIGAAYPWIEALHILAVISWMAGLLYLPRLFVYHCEHEMGSASAEMLAVMELRLLRFIMTPAMVGVLVLGLLLASVPGAIDWSAGWIYVKLTAVLGMFAAHGMMARWRREFAAGENRRSARFYRIANEVPALLMVVIVVMVVVKPF